MPFALLCIIFMTILIVNWLHSVIVYVTVPSLLLPRYQAIIALSETQIFFILSFLLEVPHYKHKFAPI